MKKLKSMMVKPHQQAAKVMYEMVGSIQIKLAKISKKAEFNRKRKDKHLKKQNQ